MIKTFSFEQGLNVYAIVYPAHFSKKNKFNADIFLSIRKKFLCIQ